MNILKIKTYQNRHGYYGAVPEDSTLTGSAVDLASFKTKEFAELVVQRFNLVPELGLAVKDATEEIKRLRQ